MNEESYQNKMQDKRLDNIDKHIEIINSEMGSVKNDVAWLKRFFWLVASASIGGLITALINLLVTLSKYGS
jgi:lipopolysaccharide/colanic/teichoic acid biosynthesis glycosyltransferase